MSVHAVAHRVGADAAVRRLLDQIDELDRVLLARLWAAQPQSQRALAGRLGVHNASVYRNQPRAQARLAELLADPVHQEVGYYASGLGRRLGPYAPEDAVATELNRIDVDPASESAQALLYLAGPLRAPRSMVREHDNLRAAPSRGRRRRRVRPLSGPVQ